MLLLFINDESITGESFRATAQTVFRVGVTNNLFEILINRRLYLYKSYSKSFKIWWTDKPKTAVLMMDQML